VSGLTHPKVAGRKGLEVRMGNMQVIHGLESAILTLGFKGVGQKRRK
jgi:hypothetical protein